MGKYKVFDLFSGAGGMAEGFLRAGFDIPYATDISADASKTYMNRHKQLNKELKYFLGDINDLANSKSLKDFLGEDFYNIDVVCGGPPCQGFSLAGKRDANDPRNKLVFSYLEILRILKPKYFIMENVVGLLSTICEEYQGSCGTTYSEKKVIDILINEFENIGFEVKYKILNAYDYGVPQNRQRVIIIGTNISRNIKFPNFPEMIDEKVSVYEAIDDLKKIGNADAIDYYNLETNSKYQKESRVGRVKRIEVTQLTNHVTSNHTKKVIERFELLKQGENFNSLFKRLHIDQLSYYLSKKNNCKKLSMYSSSPTVTTLPDDIIHYSENRILTVRELARIQSFDDSFVFYGKRTTGGKRRKFETPQYTQVGNAVPPLLSYAIAKELMLALKSSEKGID